MKNIRKIILVGDSNVGKTSLTHWYIYRTDRINNLSTIGANFYSKNTMNNKLQIWDTAGQEKFRSIIKMYYRNTSACILVFDVGDINTFKHLTEWKKEVDEANQSMVYVMVANKSDLEHKVDRKIIQDFSDTYSIPWYYTNSINGSGIDSVFELIDYSLISTTTTSPIVTNSNCTC